jgi:murein DD-endopeptidase MepM/ murein hydrolase activator NlpD
MSRGNRAALWPRVITALIVALFATVATARLFIDSTRDASDHAALDDVNLAGRVDGQFIEQPELIKAAPEPVAIALTLDRPASVADYLEDAGLDRNEAQRWAWFFNKTAESTYLERGHTLTLYKDPETGDLRELRYNLSDRIAVSERTYGQGVIRSSPELIKYAIRPVAVAFRVENDFWHEAQRNGLPKPIVATLEYAFEDRHPLNDLPRGSAIKLIYQEKVSRDGTSRTPTGLEAAQIRIGNKTLSAFAFRDEQGQAHLYDGNGEALGPKSMRFPLQFDYISSGFTERRYHPILHIYRPHAGVDLVAHYGTPVRTVADGRIEAAGWCGELGRCVRVAHEGGIVSIYGHLSQVSVEPGRNVRVGDVIGRVGSSGLSTGAHLHFGVEKDGHPVDPLTQSLGTSHHVSPRMKVLFEQLKQKYLTTLNRVPYFGSHLRLPGTITASTSTDRGNIRNATAELPGTTGRSQAVARALSIVP